MRSTLSVFFFVGVLLSLTGLGISGSLSARVLAGRAGPRARRGGRDAGGPRRPRPHPARRVPGRRPRGLHGLGAHAPDPFARLTLELAVGTVKSQTRDAGAAARRSSGLADALVSP